MLAQVAGEVGHRLLVRGQAHLDRDALVGDELREVLDVALAIADARARDLGVVEEPGAVADAVGVEVADRLEDRLGPVVLAGVDGLAEEGLVSDLVGLPVILRGVALLLAGEVDAHHEQTLLASEPRGRARDLEARRGVDLTLRGLGQRLEEAAEALRELGAEEAHRTKKDAGGEAGRASLGHLGAGVEGVGGPAQAAIDGAHDVGHLEARPHVELGGEAHLDVANAVGLAVLGQLEGRPLERLGILQHGDRVAEALEVLGEARVARPENQRLQAFGRLRGQGHLAFAGEVDQRGETERAVQVDVEVRLRQATDQLPVHGRRLSIGAAT